MLRHVAFSLSMFFEASIKMVFLKESCFFHYKKFIISKPSNIIFPEVLQDLIFWLTVPCYIMPHNNVTWRNNILKNT